MSHAHVADSLRLYTAALVGASICRGLAFRALVFGPKVESRNVTQYQRVVGRGARRIGRRIARGARLCGHELLRVHAGLLGMVGIPVEIEGKVLLGQLQIARVKTVQKSVEPARTNL